MSYAVQQFDEQGNELGVRNVSGKELGLKYTLPAPSPGEELHPGDFVVLTESDPYYVGDQPEIQQAIKTGVPGRIIGKALIMLTQKEQVALGRESAYEVVVKFPTAHRPFRFWHIFLKKLVVETIR